MSNSDLKCEWIWTSVWNCAGSWFQTSTFLRSNQLKYGKGMITTGGDIDDGLWVWLPAVLVPRSTQIKTYSWDNAQVLLVGNKCDMDDERVVSGDRGRQLSEHLGEFTHVFTHTCDSLLSTQTWSQSTRGALISFKNPCYGAGSCVFSLKNSGGTNHWITTTGCTRLTRKRASVLEETWERFSHNITCFQTRMRSLLCLRPTDVSER